MRGYVKHLNERGCRFSRAEDGKDYYFHARNLPDSLPFAPALQERQVEFDAEKQPDGRWRAVNVRSA